MSRDKQIEEIYNDLCDAPTGSVNSDFTIGTLQESHTNLFIKILAGHLYSKGYRKSTDVAEEIFAEIEETFKECLWFLENHPSDYPRMDRTKINVYKDNLQYIAEIKNKYKGE